MTTINNAEGDFFCKNKKNYRDYYNPYHRLHRNRNNQRTFKKDLDAKKEILKTIKNNFQLFLSESDYYKHLVNSSHNFNFETLYQNLQMEFENTNYLKPKYNLDKKLDIIKTLLDLGKENLPSSLQDYLHLLYQGLIDYLEAFLQDTFIVVLDVGNTVDEFANNSGNDELAENYGSIKKACKEYNQSNKSQENLANLKAKLIEIALNKITWHQFEKIQLLYKLIGIDFNQFQYNADALNTARDIRNDIVHRGGKKKDGNGEKHELDPESINSLIQDIENFTNGITDEIIAQFLQETSV